MTLVRVNNPLFKSFDGIMKDLFNEIPTKVGKSVREDVLHFPPANIIEKADSYTVELSVPGFTKEDFNVKLDNNMLTVSTEKKEESNDSTDKFIRREFSYRAFNRSFVIDEKIETEKIAAKYENGILTLELPKKESEKKVTKEISVQ